MLNDLLTDEVLAREVLDYILSGRQITEKVSLKTIENYQNKRKPQNVISRKSVNFPQKKEKN